MRSVHNNSKLLVVLAYEFKKMAMNKVFLIITLLGPFLLAGITVVPALIAVKTLDRTGNELGIGILAPGESLQKNAASLLVPAIEAKGWKPLVSDSEASLRARVLDGSLDGYLKLPPAFPSEDVGSSIAWYSKSSTDLVVFSAIEKIVSSLVISDRIAKASLDETYIRSLVENVQMTVYKVAALEEKDGKESTEGDYLAALMTGVVFCMLIYMTVLLYGQQIGRSVVAEKSSKIIDILLSSVDARDLLYGKILGIGLAGLVQYAAWIGMALIVFEIVGPAAGLPLAVSVSPDKFAWLFAFFLGGYLLYSSVYAACGAASEDDQHMAQLSIPVLLFLMFPVFLMQTFIQMPDSPFAVALSFFPLTSPMVMLIRILSSDLPLWEPLVSIALLFASVIGLGSLAAKIFRTGLLMSGKNFSFKDIALWLKG